MTKLTSLGYRALRELRGQRGGDSHRYAEFTAGGIPKPNPKPAPKITLRRADYDRQKAEQ